MAQDLRKSFEQEQIEKDSPDLESVFDDIEEEDLPFESQEQQRESQAEKESDFKKEDDDEKEEIDKPVEPIIAPVAPPVNPYIERQKEIDNILAEGLEDIYLKMSPARQQKFKREGEETVRKINKLLSQAKVKVEKIINLIRRWLKNIPKVNKHFLEQESKIKADKIIKLKKEENIKNKK